MKFGQFTSYYKKKKIIKFFAKTSTWKLVAGLSVFARNWAQLLLENEVFEVRYLS